MSRSIKPPSFLRRTFTVLAVAGTVIASISYIQEFAKIDPLVNMRKGSIKGPDQQGMTLQNVRLVHYRGTKKLGEAMVDKAFIPEDRSEYQLAGVRKGTYYGKEDGKPMNFSAPRTVWRTIERTLVADRGVRLYNTDLDLKTEIFRINERQDTLYVPGRIKGLFFKGNLDSINLLYDMKKKVVKFGETSWNGNLALALQDGDKPGQKRWEFKSANGEIDIDGDIRKWSKGTATDGEIIIQADLIEHNNKTDVVTATGHVRYFSVKANVTCDKVVAYRKEKRAVLTGSVDMLVKPKDKQTKAEIVEIPPFRPIVPAEVSKDRPTAPANQRDPKQKQLDDDVQNPKSLRAYPMAITANKIEYWYGKGNRHAIITGSPQARQELPEGRWRHLWANSALYDGEKETLELKSRPGETDARVQTSIGDDIVAEEVWVSTEEDVEKLKAKGAKGSVYGNSDDEDGGPGIKPPDPLKPGGKGGDLKGKIGGGSTKG